MIHYVQIKESKINQEKSVFNTRTKSTLKYKQRYNAIRIINN